VSRINWIILALCAVILSGCGAVAPTDGDGPNQLELVNARLQNIENTLNILTDRVNRMQEDYDGKLLKMQDDLVLGLHDLEKSIDNLYKQVATLRPNEKPLDVLENQVLARDKAQAEIAKLLEHKDYTLTLQEIRPIANEAVPALVRTLADPKTRPLTQYRANLTKVLSKLPADLVINEVVPLLEQDDIRNDAAQILGDLGDKRAAKTLANYVGTTDERFKFQLGVALVQLQNEAGILILINALESDDQAVNTIAIDTLKKVFGVDWGYKPWVGKEERLEAVAKWRAYWEKYQGQGIFDGKVPEKEDE
jgi:uncharacterized protein YoxC